MLCFGEMTEISVTSQDIRQMAESAVLSGYVAYLHDVPAHKSESIRTLS